MHTLIIAVTIILVSMATVFVFSAALSNRERAMGRQDAEAMRRIQARG